MKLRHITILTLFVLVNIIVLMTLNFGSGDLDEETAETEFIQTLEATVAENKNTTFQINGFGTVTAYNAVDLACEVQGKLLPGQHRLKPGVKFRKGALLFKVDRTEAEYNLRSRKSGFINILANLLPDLKVEFPSEYNKWENYIDRLKLNEPLPELPAWKTNKEKIFISTRNVLTEYFSIKSMETQIRKYTVFAPFNGMITDVYVTESSVVNPGTRVIRIAETGNFEIPVSISATEAEQIEIGTEVTLYTTAGVERGVGTVSRMAEMINKSTQSIDVYIQPEKANGEPFVEGEYLKVAINKEQAHKGIMLPNKAISNNKVYLYSKKDSTLTQQPIDILHTADEGVFVGGIPDQSIVIKQSVLNYTDTTKYAILMR